MKVSRSVLLKLLLTVVSFPRWWMTFEAVRCDMVPDG